MECNIKGNFRKKVERRHLVRKSYALKCGASNPWFWKKNLSQYRLHLSIRFTGKRQNNFIIMIKVIGIPFYASSSFLKGPAHAPTRIGLMEYEGSANVYSESGK